MRRTGMALTATFWVAPAPAYAAIVIVNGGAIAGRVTYTSLEMTKR